MTSWLLYEWGGLPHGESKGHIPEALAARFARSVEGSPLRPLDHRRKGLHARGAVGVVAVEGHALEILPKIDVGEAHGEAERAGRVRQHLVRMLATANDIRIEPGELTALDWQRHTLLDLLIRLFASRLSETLREGMPRRYAVHAEDLRVLRGRLDVVRQFSALAADPSRLACRFDALTPDIMLNRIMKAVVMLLSRMARAEETRRHLRELAFLYADVADVSPAELRWEEVVLDRTNRRWRDLLALARLFLEGRYQTTSTGAGGGIALLFDMSRLFEAYVARMLAKALQGTDLRAITQGGLRYCLTGADGNLFQTKPDILVKRAGRVIAIVDTKWKRLMPRTEDDRRGVTQADVYQMLAYARVYGCERLVLLYPHHGGLLESSGLLVGHCVSGGGQLDIATVDVGAGDEVQKIGALLCRVVTV